MQDEKSQLQNRERAMKVLRARLYEAELAEQQAELAADRSSQVGTGDRAEKIRTYNFPQRRVTDHRIKLHRAQPRRVLAGELDELTAALQDAEKRRRLEDRRAVEPPRARCDHGPRRARLGGDPADRGGLRHAAAGRRGAARGGAGRRPRGAIADSRRELDGRARRARSWSARRRRREREPVAYIIGAKGFRLHRAGTSTGAC